LEKLSRYYLRVHHAPIIQLKIARTSTINSGMRNSPKQQRLRALEHVIVDFVDENRVVWAWLTVEVVPHLDRSVPDNRDCRYLASRRPAHIPKMRLRGTWQSDANDEGRYLRTFRSGRRRLLALIGNAVRHPLSEYGTFTTEAGLCEAT
jgi:hypothetical protein